MEPQLLLTSIIRLHAIGTPLIEIARRQNLLFSVVQKYMAQPPAHDAIGQVLSLLAAAGWQVAYQFDRDPLTPFTDPVTSPANPLWYSQDIAPGHLKGNAPITASVSEVIEMLKESLGQSSDPLRYQRAVPEIAAIAYSMPQRLRTAWSVLGGSQRLVGSIGLLLEAGCRIVVLPPWAQAPCYVIGAETRAQVAVVPGAKATAAKTKAAQARPGKGMLAKPPKAYIPGHAARLSHEAILELYDQVDKNGFPRYTGAEIAIKAKVTRQLVIRIAKRAGRTSLPLRIRMARLSQMVANPPTIG